MLRGSCLCGGVRYEIAGPLSGALNCHCSMCRKAHGAAFRTAWPLALRLIIRRTGALLWHFFPTAGQILLG